MMYGVIVQHFLTLALEGEFISVFSFKQHYSAQTKNENRASCVTPNHILVPVTMLQQTYPR